MTRILPWLWTTALAFSLTWGCEKQSDNGPPQAPTLTSSPARTAPATKPGPVVQPGNEERVSADQVPKLIKDLDSPDAAVRLMAAMRLERVEPIQAARPAVPKLLHRTKDKSPQMRRQALVSLAEIVPEEAKIFRLALGLLNEKDHELRSAAARALSAHARATQGSQEKERDQILAKIRAHPDLRTRGWLIDSVKYYKGGLAEIQAMLDVLPPALMQRVVYTAEWVVREQEDPQERKTAEEILVRIAKSRVPGARDSAAKALEKIGKPPPAKTPPPPKP